MSKIATIEEILAASEKEVELPELSKTVGETRTVKVRKISQPEFRQFLPPSAPGAETWAKEDFEEKTKIWVAGLDAETVAHRERLMADLNGRLLAMAALEPKLTFEQAQRLGGDAVVAAAEILRFSGLIAEAPADEAPVAA